MKENKKMRKGLSILLTLCLVLLCVPTTAIAAAEDSLKITDPAAKDLTYTGEDQALVTAGTCSGGTMVYNLAENGEYTETIPTGKNAGTYTVWYKVIGDDNHSASAAESVSVTIKKAAASVEEAPKAVENLVYTGSAQKLVTPGTAKGGTLMYNALNSFDRNFTEKIPTGTFAREYYVYYYVKGDANHENSEKQLVKVNLAHAEIDSIDVTIAAPVAGEVPQGTVYYDGLYYARPNWSPAVDTFDFNTVYTASVQVMPKNTNAYVFSEEAFEAFSQRMTAEGWSIIGNNKSMTLKKTFEATRKAEVIITAEDQTIQYGQTIAADAYSVDSEVEGCTVSAVLNASTANVTVNGTITPSAAVITADGTDITADCNVSFRSGKLVIEPDTSGIDDLTVENVTSDAIKAVLAMMASAETDGIDEATAEKWTAITAKCEELLDAIEALENVKDVTESITQLPETVEPNDEEAAEKILNAKKAYDALTDYEKSLVDKTTKEKLEHLLAALTAYDIIAEKSASPVTGDYSNLMLWHGVLWISTLGLVFLLADCKRRISTK